MAGPNLSTSRVPDNAVNNPATHAADHNAAHAIVNRFDTAGANLPITVKDPAYGAVGNGTTNDSVAFEAAMDAADALGPGTEVEIPPGVYNVGNGLSLNGHSCTLRGTSAGFTSGGGAAAAGTVLWAKTQTGPALDFTGWVAPANFNGRASFGGFAVRGSNVADATLVKSGIKIDAFGSAYLHDIAISETGGPPMDIVPSTPGIACYLSDFARITLTPPVSVLANDVPWLRAKGMNGCRWFGLGLRSTASADDVGASGAIVLSDDGTYAPQLNAFYGTWFENLHVANAGTLIQVAGNRHTFDASEFFDCFKVSGATGTSHFRFLPPSVTNSGGNEVTGLIPGHGTNALDIDCGVDIRQNGNRVAGVKGYRGDNVILASGVNYCHVDLGGAESGVPATLGWTDNSGTTTNYFRDTVSGVEKVGGFTRRFGTGAPTSIVENVGAEYVQTDGNVGAVKWVKSTASGSSGGWTPLMAERLITATLVSNQSITFGNAMVHRYVLGASITFTSISGARNGALFVLSLVQDATGSRIVTWPGSIKWAGGAAPTLTTTANKQDTLTFVYDGTNWVELSRALNA